ncbi:MAG: molybdopterin-guanine dinucleotide biosynthesis protein A-like protein [Bacillota bacterium]|nr:MAG: molybdopterin-guanine dinucleotide biosynthesis protein A-like protein [Bacillota bacterium]MBS3950617.1 nucleotidyltransferase family protein [Peptococcaceae bacterium]
MNAVILAGGGKTDSFAHKHGAENKALIPIGDKLMFEYVYSALRNSRYIQEIVIVGPVREFSKYVVPGVQVLEDTGDMVDNCLAAIHRLPQDQPVALVTSDIPMLTTGVLDNYLAGLEGLEGDFFYPIISKATNEDRYPGVKRTYAILREGTFTGGNLTVLNPVVADLVASKVRALVSERKNVFKMGSLIGFGFLFRLLLRQLTIPEAEKRLSQLFCCKCKAVECFSPEIGTDVDKDSDLELARKVLAGS